MCGSLRERPVHAQWACADTSNVDTPLQNLRMLMSNLFTPPQLGGSVQQELAQSQTCFLGSAQVSQLQLCGANQPQSSGFFWSQAALEGPSHFSSSHRSQRDEKTGRALAASSWSATRPSPPPPRIPRVVRGSQMLSCALLLQRLAICLPGQDNMQPARGCLEDQVEALTL